MDHYESDEAYDSADDLDFSDLEGEYHVPYEEGFENLVVVDGAPRVGESKKSSLVRVLTKLFKDCGPIKEDGIFMPMEDRDGAFTSKGYLFVEYETPEQAINAVKTLNGKKLDKAHTLLVNKFTDVEKYAAVDDEFKQPQEESYIEHEHLRCWMTDGQGRDQLVMYRGDEVSVAWNRKQETPEVIVARQNWTETYVQWSPLGSYLASLHRQGLQLWGGPSLKPIARFAHSGVRLFDFSPKENYLVTWSNDPLELPPLGHPRRETMPFTAEDEGKQIFIWDLKKGLLLGSFLGLPLEHNIEDKGPKKMVWPVFKWSSDEKYFARVHAKSQISVYEAPGMGLVGRKSIKLDGVVDFEWSPVTSAEQQKSNEQLFCFWTPEINNQPARVSLMTIPSKEVIRTKNLFSVSDCKLHWQNNGDFLCVKVDRHTKTKKSSFTNLEIFRITEKNIPVEVVEIKDTVINFAWEPKGSRFAVIQTSDHNVAIAGVTLKTILAFYALEKNKQGTEANFKLVRAVDKKTVNSLYWAPKGRFLAAATLGSTSTFDLEFWDVDFEGEKKEEEKEFNANLQCLSTAEHYGVTDVEWDPSGRYLLTSSSAWKHRMENGYHLWDFKGALIRQEHVDQLNQVIWRPRPPTYLSKTEQKDIRKNLKVYAKQFEEEDNLKQNTANQELVAQRRRLLEEWSAWRESVKSDVSKKRKEYGKQLDLHQEAADEYVEEVVEIVESETIEEVNE